MSEKYEVINTTSLFFGRVGCKTAKEITNEIVLAFDGPKGNILASFHPSEIERLEYTRKREGSE